MKMRIHNYCRNAWRERISEGHAHNASYQLGTGHQNATKSGEKRTRRVDWASGPRTADMLPRPLKVKINKTENTWQCNTDTSLGLRNSRRYRLKET